MATLNGKEILGFIAKGELHKVDDITPRIGENGNWFIGPSDDPENDTGVKAKGENPVVFFNGNIQTKYDGSTTPDIGEEYIPIERFTELGYERVPYVGELLMARAYNGNFNLYQCVARDENRIIVSKIQQVHGNNGANGKDAATWHTVTEDLVTENSDGTYTISEYPSDAGPSTYKVGDLLLETTNGIVYKVIAYDYVNRNYPGQEPDYGDVYTLEFVMKISGTGGIQLNEYYAEITTDTAVNVTRLYNIVNNAKSLGSITINDGRGYHFNSTTETSGLVSFIRWSFSSSSARMEGYNCTPNNINGTADSRFTDMRFTVEGNTIYDTNTDAFTVTITYFNDVEITA